MRSDELDNDDLMSTYRSDTAGSRRVIVNLIVDQVLWYERRHDTNTWFTIKLTISVDDDSLIFQAW